MSIPPAPEGARLRVPGKGLVGGVRSRGTAFWKTFLGSLCFGCHFASDSDDYSGSSSFPVFSVSPLHPPDYVPEPRTFRRVSSKHR